MAGGQLACCQDDLTEDPAHRDLPEDSESGRILLYRPTEVQS